MGYLKKSKEIKRPPAQQPAGMPARDVTSCDRVLRSTRGTSRRLLGYAGRPPKRLFTPEIKRQLKQWLVRRRRYPYPSRDEKRRLAQDTGLDYNQICNWFANWRRKLKNAECEESSGGESGGEGAGLGASSWGRRILRYNHVAARNAEKIPILAEDCRTTETDHEDMADSDRSDSPASECVDATAMDHCYSLLPPRDQNGNYEAPQQKWLASVRSFTPQRPTARPSGSWAAPAPARCTARSIFIKSMHIQKWVLVNSVARMHFDILDELPRPDPAPTVPTGPPGPPGKGLSKRTILTVREKFEICGFKDAHGNLSHQNVADHFSARWAKKVSRRVIGDILADRHKWSEDAEDGAARSVKRFKGGKHEELEDLLERWVSEATSSEGNLTDLAITEQAKVFGHKLGILEFQYSSGWLHRFKRRRGLLSKPTPRPAKAATPPSGKFNEEHFFEDGSTLHQLSGQLYSNYGLNSSSGSSAKLQTSTVSIPKVDEANYPLDEMISSQQIKKESIGDTLEEFFRKPPASPEIIGDVSATEAERAVQKLKLFFESKPAQKDVVAKIQDIEQELKVYL